MEFLVRIRKKPAHIRSRIALGAAVGITAFIAVIWSTTLPARFAALGGTIDEGKGEQTGAIQDGFDSFFESLQNDSALLPPPETTPAQPESQPEPITEHSMTDSMNGLGDWDTTPPTETESSESGTETEAAEPRVILIGTTPKTVE